MKLSDHRILRWFAIPAVLGGLIYLFQGINAFFPSPGSTPPPMLNMIIGLTLIISVLLWFTGIFLRQRNEIKVMGSVGFIATIVGFFLLGLWFYKSGFSEANMKFALWNAISLILFVWGLLMFGTSLLNAGGFPRLAISLWMAGFVISNAVIGFKWPGRYLLVGAGMIWCGIYFWLKQTENQKAVPNAPVRQDDPQRYKSLDLFRGLIMTIMAIDHACAMIIGKHSTEFWNLTVTGYTDGVSFLTRFTTHICAPGFFFLMGTGMILLAESRRKSGWTHRRVMGHLALRGALLIVLEQILWVPMLYGTVSFTKFSVLFCLGGAMVVCTLFLKLNRSSLLCIGLAGILLTQVLPQALLDIGIYQKPVAILLLVPQIMGDWNNLYPVFPWMSITVLGMVFGKQLIINPQKAYSWMFVIGLAFLALFAIIRGIGGFGNFRASAGPGWIDFLNVIKYPPSLVFTLWTLGIIFVLLFLIEKYHHKFGAWTNPLLVFGKTALFFFFAHWFLFGSTSGLFYVHVKANYLWLYAGWGLGLLLLYPICRQYLDFKQKTPPNSVWRFV